MSTPDYALLIPVDLGGLHLRPGTGLSNTADSATISALIAAFGAGALWPWSDATVQAAALQAQSEVGRRPESEMAALMLSAVTKSLSLSSAGSPQMLTQTIAFGDFAALAATTKDYSLSAAMPTGARLLALPSLEAETGFDDPTHAAFAVTVGTAAGGAQLGASTSVNAAASGFPKAMAAGGYVGMSLSGALVSARMTGGVNLNTVTIGSVTLKVPYVVLP